MSFLRRLAREPLVHFLVLGTLLFLWFAWRGGGASSGRIVLTPGRIEHLVAGFTRTWQRPPTEEELKALLDDYVREEMATREAIAMGLDADDTVVRRRLRQKLEFLAEDEAAAAPVTDQELETWIDRHPESFRAEPELSLRQVYVSRDRRGEAAENDARHLLSQLQKLGPEAAIEELGDPLMAPQEVELAPRAEIASLFGDDFAAAVLALAPGAWSGPIESGYGLHLVLVRERVEQALPDLASIRPLVEREVLEARRKAQLDAMYQRLLEKYTVTIERPAPTSTSMRRRAGRSVRLRALVVLLGAAIALSATGALAHEVRPGFLELRENEPGRYSLLWKKPSGGEVELEMAPVVPAGCDLSSADRQQLVPGATIARATLICSGGLAGKTLAIAGLEATVTDVLVRLHHADGRLESHLLRPTHPAVELGAASGGLERALSYLRLGVQHIVLGVDHLLFVLGLLLIVGDRITLVKTVTAFTLAHSITLAIATLGYASAPLPPLNVAIALSILFLGPEIVRTWRGESSFTIRHPWVVAFAFGLLHGFGFATGLATMGLPRTEIPLALLLFNVGVELGQLAFVFLVLALARSFRTLEIHWPSWARALPGYAVGALGAMWTIQRAIALVAAAA